MAAVKGNAVIGQSGGPTSVINQSLVGVVEEVKKNAPHIDKLLGCRHGVRGIDNYDNASLPGIKVDVIMGRHAGFLTAASVLARQHDEDGPHLIYVPEAPLS